METGNANYETISSLKDSLTRTKSKLKAMEAEVANALNMVENIEHSRPVYSDELIDKKLSYTAKVAIQATNGPLNPQKLTEFLMKEVFGKPKPGVLPIFKKYTQDVEALRQQVLKVKEFVDEMHLSYMEEQRRLDLNLHNRIERLNKNILKELENESKSGRRQVAITECFPKRKTRQTTTNKICNENSNDVSGLPGSSKQ